MRISIHRGARPLGGPATGGERQGRVRGGTGVSQPEPNHFCLRGRSDFMPEGPMC